MVLNDVTVKRQYINVTLRVKTSMLLLVKHLLTPNAAVSVLLTGKKLIKLIK